MILYDVVVLVVTIILCLMSTEHINIYSTSIPKSSILFGGSYPQTASANAEFLPFQALPLQTPNPSGTAGK